MDTSSPHNHEETDDPLRQALLTPSTPEAQQQQQPLPSSPTARQQQQRQQPLDDATSVALHTRLVDRPEGDSHRSVSQELDAEFEDETFALVRYTVGIQKCRSLLLIVTALALWPLGFRSFIAFSKDTDSSFHSVPGSPSAQAETAFAAAYGHENDFRDPMKPPLVLVLSTNPRTNSSNARTKTTAPSLPSLIKPHTKAYQQAYNFSMGLVPYLQQEHCWRWPDDDDTSKTNSNTTTCNLDQWLRATSYYSVMDDQLSWIAKRSLLADSSVLLTVEYTLPRNESRYHKRRVIELMNVIDEYTRAYFQAVEQRNQTAYFTVRYTGLKYFASDLSASTRHDLARMDRIVLPLALILMGIVLPNANPFAIWVVPVVTMMSTVSCWSILMRFFANQNLEISSFTPTVMMSLTLGMGIDYTMFLLARYLEEMKSGHSRKRAVLRTLSGSGHVLVLSGLTLASVFGGLAFLPLSMLKSVGIGAATAIISSLAVNLTLVPALLFTRLGVWIIQNDTVHNEAVSPNEGEWQPTSSFLDETPVREDDHSGRLSEPSSLSFPRSSIWFGLSKQLLHPYRGIIVILVTCQLLLPVVHYAGQMKSSISFDLLLPAKSPSLQTFHALSEQVGPGSLNPYRILFDGHAANISMTSSTGFKVMHRVFDELRAIHQHGDGDTDDLGTFTSDGVPSSLKHEIQELSNAIFNDTAVSDVDTSTGDQKATSFNGIAILGNKKIPHAVYVSAKICSEIQPHCPIELLHVIDALDGQATSTDEYATYVTATLGTNPFGDDGVEWLTEARAVLARLHHNTGGDLHGIRVYLQGSAAIAHDAVDAVYEAFPTMIVVTTLLVFVLMGLFFKSVFPPIRSIVSIGLTLSFSFGLSVLVFQHGVLDRVHLRTLTSMGDEVCWLVPIMAFSIVVGLALDYDVFLISRILEYRMEGYEHKSSIALGLDATGGIITAAGIIMSVAFGSLMFSSNPVLYQWSFLLTTAVLLDTFVIRTIVVPILTGLAGEHCWWPRQLPDERLCFVDFEKPMSAEDVASRMRTLESTSQYEPLATLIERHENAGIL